jgi:hypothetical protein
MAQCTTCGAYTKYEGGLCLDCYNEKKSGKKEAVTEPKKKVEKEGGLPNLRRVFVLETLRHQRHACQGPFLDHIEV